MADSSNKIILKNTVLLYGRTLILLVLGLYTSRVTMQALGVESYGIINVVGGFVSMFALISGALTGACQRFITFELGKNDGNVRQIFSCTFYIHLALAIIIVLLAETAGLYFVNAKLNLPADRMGDVQWVFQCSVISFMLNLLNIPYNALIIAHEKMSAFAYITIVEALLKLVTVYSILVLPYSPLILYSVLTMVSSTAIRFIYQIYSMRKFKTEASLERIRDYSGFKSILGFSGWAFIGNTATLLNNQGINIILNIFAGVTINAARGIASMVESTVSSFVYNFTTALNPQITKSYAQKDKNRLLELLNLGTRLSFFLMIVMSIPIIIAAPDILNIWLTVFPDYAVIFLRLTLVIAIVQAMANPYITAVCATGDIRSYQLVVGLLTLANIPVCYVILKIGLDPAWVYVTSLVMYVITFVIRMLFVRNKAHIPVRGLCVTIITRLVSIALMGFAISYALSRLIPTANFFGLVLFAAFSCIVTVALIYAVGINSNERRIVLNYVKSKVFKRQ